MTYVPQIKGLRVADILAEARKHVNIDDYMPDMKDDKLPNRDFVVNVGKGAEKLIVCSEYFDPGWTAKNSWGSKNWKRRKIYKKRTCEWKYFPSFREYSQIQKKYQVRKKLLNIKGHNGRFHQLVRSTEMRRLAKEVKNRGQVAEEEESKEKDQIIEDLKRKVIDFEELNYTR